MATAMTFKRALGIAKESSWPPTGGTSPTVWAPSYDPAGTDFFQEPAVIEPPQTRGDRAFYDIFRGHWTTTGSISDIMLTPEVMATLLEGILSEVDSVYSYYTREDAIPPSFCFTYQKDGIWWQARGMYLKTFNITFAPEVATAAIDLAGYAVVQTTAVTPSFPSVIKAFPFWNLAVEMDAAAIEAKEVSLSLESGIPDANLVSGSKYTSTLVPGMLTVNLDISLEEDQTRRLELIEPTARDFKLTATSHDGTSTLTFELPNCYPTSRPDARDDSNIGWDRVTYRALVDTTEGFEIRVTIG